jgi:hypothetical protein
MLLAYFAGRYGARRQDHRSGCNRGHAMSDGEWEAFDGTETNAE